MLSCVSGIPVRQCLFAKITLSATSCSSMQNERFSSLEKADSSITDNYVTSSKHDLQRRKRNRSSNTYAGCRTWRRLEMFKLWYDVDVTTRDRFRISEVFVQFIELLLFLMSSEPNPNSSIQSNPIQSNPIRSNPSVTVTRQSSRKKQRQWWSVLSTDLPLTQY
jgi:hypothetical protein